MEEGEIESDVETLNPMVSVTKIDPKEIPEVSNKFLMRDRETTNRFDDDDRKDRGFGWSKRTIPRNSSGKILKGRGNFRFKRDSRSRSRSATPKHWKQAQSKTIKWNEFEKLEKEKKSRDDEVKRRADERKRRHEALSRGDGKKSFFELTQTIPEPTVHPTKASSESDHEKQRSGSVDLNALDYEESDSEKSPARAGNKNGKSSNEKLKRSRSRSRSRSYRRKSRSRSHRRDKLDRRNVQPAVAPKNDDSRDNRPAVRRNRWDDERRVRHSRERQRRSHSNRSKSRDRWVVVNMNISLAMGN